MRNALQLGQRGDLCYIPRDPLHMQLVGMFQQVSGESAFVNLWPEKEWRTRTVDFCQSEIESKSLCDLIFSFRSNGILSYRTEGEIMDR
jgi:hypothetical protein